VPAIVWPLSDDALMRKSAGPRRRNPDSGQPDPTAAWPCPCGPMDHLDRYQSMDLRRWRAFGNTAPIS